jgi:hypothetical protein
MAFVKEFHTTGLVWNPSGGNALQAGKLEQEQSGRANTFLGFSLNTVGAT